MLRTPTRDSLDPGPLLLSPLQVCALLGISKGQLYAEMRLGRLHGLIIGSRSRRFSRSELERYIAERERVSA